MTSLMSKWYHWRAERRLRQFNNDVATFIVALLDGAMIFPHDDYTKAVLAEAKRRLKSEETTV